MVLAHLFVAAILVMYTYLYSPTVCFVPLLKYFIKKPPCTKPIPQNIWPKTNGETNLEMQNYFDAGNGLIIHDDKKDTGNNSDNQRQKCVLAYIFIFSNPNLCLFHEPLVPMKVELIHCASMQYSFHIILFLP